MLISLVEDRSKASGWAGLSSLDLRVAAGHELSSVLFYVARELQVGSMSAWHVQVRSIAVHTLLLCLCAGERAVK